MDAVGPQPHPGRAVQLVRARHADGGRRGPRDRARRRCEQRVRREQRALHDREDARRDRSHVAARLQDGRHPAVRDHRAQPELELPHLPRRLRHRGRAGARLEGLDDGAVGPGSAVPGLPRDRRAGRAGRRRPVPALPHAGRMDPGALDAHERLAARRRRSRRHELRLLSPPRRSGLQARRQPDRGPVRARRPHDAGAQPVERAVRARSRRPSSRPLRRPGDAARVARVAVPPLQRPVRHLPRRVEPGVQPDRRRRLRGGPARRARRLGRLDEDLSARAHVQRVEGERLPGRRLPAGLRRHEARRHRRRLRRLPLRRRERQGLQRPERAGPRTTSASTT